MDVGLWWVDVGFSVFMSPIHIMFLFVFFQWMLVYGGLMLVNVGF